MAAGSQEREQAKEITRLEAELRQAQAELRRAESELADRRQEIFKFEARMEARLGRLMDRLAALEEEIAGYMKTIERVRNKRVFGEDHLFDDPRYWRNWAPPEPDAPPPPAPPPGSPEEIAQRDTLYRQLARRYHPDLAEDEEDREFRNRKMTEINQAYNAGSLAQLKAMAIFAKIPATPEVQPRPPKPPRDPALRLRYELEACRRRRRQVQEEIGGLHLHPSVQLSLDVKLAYNEGRDLLGEMAADLKQSITRKSVERDYLKSQVDQLEES